MLAPFPSANSVASESIGGTAKSSFVSAKLLDGRLAVIGGARTSPNESRVDVDVYAATGLSRVAGGGLVGTGRQYAGAATLGDGRVLLVGGHEPWTGGGSVSNTTLDLVETMDPTSLEWTARAVLPNTAMFASVSTLHSGNALVVGGKVNDGALRATVYEYVQASNTWTTRTSMGRARTNHTATVLQDGRVLVVGGWSDAGLERTAEIYDPATNSWAYVAPMYVSRAAHLAVLLQDGRVLVAGGNGDSNVPQDTAEIYNPTLNTWMMTPRMASTVEEYPNSSGGCLNVLPSGLVICAGGYNEDYTASNVVEVYDAQQNIWRAIGTLSVGRAEFASMVTSTGRVLCVAGYGGSPEGPLATAEFIF